MTPDERHVSLADGDLDVVRTSNVFLSRRPPDRVLRRP